MISRYAHIQKSTTGSRGSNPGLPLSRPKSLMVRYKRERVEEGVGLHMGGLNLSITYTETVHLSPHSCL